MYVCKIPIAGQYVAFTKSGSFGLEFTHEIVIYHDLLKGAMDMEKQAFSVKEVIAATGLGRNLIYELIQRGELKSIRAGRRILVPAWALEEFLKKAN